MALPHQRLTIFQSDDLTPIVGTVDGSGNVTDPTCSTDPGHARPYLIRVLELASQELDMIEGRSSIGQLTVQILDKRLTSTNQATGWFTAQLAGPTINGLKYGQLIGHRALLEQADADTGTWRVLMNGIIGDVGLDEDMVTYTLPIRDMRERERKTPAFNRSNGTVSLYPAGLTINYGQIGETVANKYLINAVAGARATFRKSGADTFGLAYVYGVDGVAIPGLTPEQLSFLRAQSAAMMPDLAHPGQYIYYAVGIRWRAWGTSDPWKFLQNMPVKETHTGKPPGVVRIGDAYWLSSSGAQLYQVLTLYLGTYDGLNLPTDAQDIEIQVVHTGRPNESAPIYIETSFGQLLKDLYDGIYSSESPKIKYDTTAMATFVTSTPKARVKIIEPTDDLRDWVEEHIYKPLGYAPGLNDKGEIVPIKYALPDSSVTLVQLDDTNIIDAHWSHSYKDAVNKIIFKYIRESRSLGQAEKPSEKYFNVLLDETEVEVQRIHTSVSLLGPQTVEYEPATVRSFSDFRESAVSGNTVDELGTQLALARGEELFNRFSFGAQKIECTVARANANIRGLKMGDWVSIASSHLPDYLTGIRGINRIAQIISIQDLDPNQRTFVLLDGGPNSAPLAAPVVGGRTNSLLHSRNLTTGWGGAASVLFNAIGLDGDANTATTITDSDAASFQNRTQVVAIPNDSNPVVAGFWVKKDTNESRFPQLHLSLNGGTTQKQHRASFNTKTGAFISANVLNGGGAVTIVDYDANWWLVQISIFNNTSGNTSATVSIYPAARTTINGADDVAATGSVIIGNINLEINQSVGTSLPIVTTTAAVTPVIALVGGRVRVPITSMPSGASARVDYAMKSTVPVTGSGDWIFAGTVTGGGYVFTPLIPDDVAGTVWIRVRSEGVNLRPSAYSTPVSIAIAQAHRAFGVRLIIENGSNPKVVWNSNIPGAGVRIHYSVYDQDDDPGTTFAATLDVAASAGTVTIPAVVKYRQKILVALEPWSGWTGSAVSGTPTDRVALVGQRISGVYVSPLVSESATISGAIGTLTLTVTDPQFRLTKVEFRTKQGKSGTYSGWIEDVAAPYSTTVTIPAGDISYIEYRLTALDENDIASLIAQKEIQFVSAQNAPPRAWIRFVSQTQSTTTLAVHGSHGSGSSGTLEWRYNIDGDTGAATWVTWSTAVLPQNIPLSRSRFFGRFLEVEVRQPDGQVDGARYNIHGALRGLHPNTGRPIPPMYFNEPWDALPDDGGWTSQLGTPTLSLVGTVGVGSVGQTTLQIAGDTGYYLYDQKLPFNPTRLYRIRARVRQTVDDAGQSNLYIGVRSYKSDGTVANTNAGSAYVCVSAFNLTVADGWQTFTGWFKGASQADTVTPVASTDPRSPTALNTNTTQISPVFLSNYNGGSGTVQIDYIQIEEFDEDAANRIYRTVQPDGDTFYDTVKESQGKQVRRLFAKPLAGDVDNADSVIAGTVRRVPLVGGTDSSGNLNLAGTAWVNKNQDNVPDGALNGQLRIAGRTAILQRMPAHGQNLLANASFEDGTAFWWRSDGGQISVQTDSTKAKTGNKYLLIIQPSVGADVFARAGDHLEDQRSFEVLPGDIVEFGAHIHVEVGNAAVVLIAEGRDKDGTFVSSAQSASGPTGSYALRTCEYTVPSNVKKMTFTLDVFGGTVLTSARYDDVYVKILRPANDLLNGNLRGGVNESQGKPVNRLLAKVLAGDADSLDGAPDGTTYKKVIAVDGATNKITNLSVVDNTRSRVHRTTSQPITNNTETFINWDNEYYDLGGMHDNVTNNTRLTVPTGKGGVYFISTQIAWESATGSGQTNREVRIYLNGTTRVASVQDFREGSFTQSAHGVVVLAAGDFIEVAVLHNRGSALNAQGDAFGLNFFQAVHIF